MIGHPAQQGAAGHIGKRADIPLRTAFARQPGAEEGDGRILDPRREVQQHAVIGEIGQAVGLDILDAGIAALPQQGGPVIVGAHLHPALVLTHRGGRAVVHGKLAVLVACPVPGSLVVRPVGKAEFSAQAVHVFNKPLNVWGPL